MSAGQKVIGISRTRPGMAVGATVTLMHGQPPGDELNDPALLEVEGTHLELAVKCGNTERRVRITLLGRSGERWKGKCIDKGSPTPSK